MLLNACTSHARSHCTPCCVRSCNDDQGAHISCHGAAALDSGDWNWIPPDVTEQRPSFELMYEDDSPGSVGSAGGGGGEGEGDAAALAAQGLHVELLRWQDSNHVSLLSPNCYCCCCYCCCYCCCCCCSSICICAVWPVPTH
jgi:hypothetical protein